jgi:hypothetical protein
MRFSAPQRQTQNAMAGNARLAAISAKAQPQTMTVRIVSRIT